MSFYSTNRYYKAGDVLKWTPRYAEVEGKGLAIVVESRGPFFTAYFLGDGSLSKHDARPSGYNFVLQDIAPLPQAVEWVKENTDYFSWLRQDPGFEKKLLNKPEPPASN